MAAQGCVGSKVPGTNEEGSVTMHTPKMLAILALAGFALIESGASARQAAPQDAPPANAQMGCPMAQGQPMNRDQMPGMGPGQMGGRMGNMGPQGMQDMQNMHTEMAALREEMRLLREELSRKR
jgi:hypothetical protein